MSDIAQLRDTRQLAADHWVTSCKVCPKRYGRHHGPTQQNVDMWWARHVETDAHKRSASGDGKPTQQEKLLGEIFGMDLSPQYAPRDREGEVIIRKGRGRKYRDEDHR